MRLWTYQALTVDNSANRTDGKERSTRLEYQPTAISPGGPLSVMYVVQSSNFKLKIEGSQPSLSLRPGYKLTSLTAEYSGAVTARCLKVAAVALRVKSSRSESEEKLEPAGAREGL